MYLPCLLFYLFASGSFEATPVYRILKGHVVKHVKHMEAVLALLFAHFPDSFSDSAFGWRKIMGQQGQCLAKTYRKSCSLIFTF